MNIFCNNRFIRFLKGIFNNTKINLKIFQDLAVYKRKNTLTFSIYSHLNSKHVYTSVHFVL